MPYPPRTLIAPRVLGLFSRPGRSSYWSSGSVSSLGQVTPIRCPHRMQTSGSSGLRKPQFGHSWVILSNLRILLRCKAFAQAFRSASHFPRSLSRDRGQNSWWLFVSLLSQKRTHQGQRSMVAYRTLGGMLSEQDMAHTALIDTDQPTTLQRGECDSKDFGFSFRMSLAHSQRDYSKRSKTKSTQGEASK